MTNINSLEVLSNNGKSFYLAGLFLEKKHLLEIAELYSFCRYVDDCADQLNTTEAMTAIAHIKKTLLDPSLSNELQQHIQKLETLGVQRRHMLDLVAGAESDTQFSPLQNDEELDIYCYQVAGVVGLMMIPLIGVTSKDAPPHAMSLGKAMQLTNICRDILEDAQNGRTYLPQLALAKENLSIKDLQKKGTSPSSLKEIVAFYLNKADELYQEGYRGLAYIPLRYRFAILLAGEIYRHIGVKIRKNNFEVLQGRTVLSFPEKMVVIAKSLKKVFNSQFWNVPTTKQR